MGTKQKRGRISFVGIAFFFVIEKFFFRQITIFKSIIGLISFSLVTQRIGCPLRQQQYLSPSGRSIIQQIRLFFPFAGVAKPF
ncbi:MAG: hypothetical protein HUJ93_05205 [Bacteroidales bacterium]|nr:hypothetical protein [Bacteroidales bacterium]